MIHLLSSLKILQASVVNAIELISPLSLPMMPGI